MKHFKSGILIFFTFILALSCKQDIKVVFPDDITNETLEYLQTHDYNVIIYLDSADCSQCFLNVWKPYKRIFEKKNVGILLIANATDEEVILSAIQYTETKFQYVMDRNGLFKTMNNTVFRFAHDKIMVIDRNNRAVFVESPIKNEITWMSFMKMIEKQFK